MYDLLIRARGNTSDADKAMRKLQRDVKRTGKNISSVGKNMTLGLTLPVLAFGKVAYDEFTRAQKANAQTAARLKSTGGVANVTAKHINQLSMRILALSGIDDQAAQSAQNMLLTFTNVRNEAGRGNKIFDRTTLAIVDMATAFNNGAIPSAEQLRTTTIRVGKALNDPVKGMAGLVKVGVKFTDQQKEQIKQLVKSGQSMKAQKLILRELNREFGGSAAAAGKTLPAQLARLKESFASVAASVLTTFMPQIEKLLNFIQRGVTWFSKLSPATQGWIAKIALVGAVLGPVLVAIGSVVSAVSALIPVFTAVGGAISAVVGALPAIGAAITVALGPVGLIIAAVAALGVGLVLLWKKSKTFRTIVIGVFNAVKNGVMAAVNKIKTTLVAWGTAIKLVVTVAFNKIKQAIVGTLNGIRRTISGWVRAVTGLWRNHQNQVVNVVRALFNHLKLIFGPQLALIRGTVRVVSRLMHGDWRGALQAMRETARNVLRALVNLVGAHIRMVVRPIKAVFRPAWKVLTDGFKKAKDLAHDLYNKVRPIVSALAKMASFARKAGGAVAGVFSGRDGDIGMNAFLAAPRGLLNRWGLVASMGSAVGLGSSMGMSIISGLRPGAITSTGNRSDHSSGHAADFAGSKAQMYNFARAANRLPGVKQVIYSPLGWARDGGGFSPIPSSVGTVLADHYTHVHVAMHALGGIFNRPHMGVVAEAGPEAIIPLNKSRRSRVLYQQAGRAMGYDDGARVVQINQSFTGQPDMFAASRSALFQFQTAGLA